MRDLFPVINALDQGSSDSEILLYPVRTADWIYTSRKDFLTVHSFFRVTRLEEAVLSCLKSMECKQLANVFLTQLSFLIFTFEC